MAGPSFAKLFSLALIVSAPLARATFPAGDAGLQELDARELAEIEARWGPDNEAFDHLETRGRHNRKKTYVGIDFSKLRGHDQVRFILSASLANSTPTVISIPECDTWPNSMGNWSESQSCYSDSQLSTELLSTDPYKARSCQSFTLGNEDGGKKAGKKGGGYLVSVYEANSTQSSIGWQMDNNKPPTWTEDVKKDNLEGRINIDCQSWWKSRDTTKSPSYYGRYCRLKLQNSDSMCIQAAQENAWEGKPIQAAQCSHAHDLLQYFHVHAAGREFPSYAGTCGDKCNDVLYNKNPVAIVHNDKDRCETLTKFRTKYGGADWSGDCQSGSASNQTSSTT